MYFFRGNKRFVLLICSLLALLFISCGKPKTRISVLRPSKVDMSSHRSLAVVDFDGPGNSGAVVADRLTAAILKADYFTMMERSRIQEILSEQALGLTGAIDMETAPEVGQILGVKALIFGTVGAYEVEDVSGSEKVKKQVWTGEYEKDEDGNIIYEKTLFGKVKKKKYEEVYVDQPYIIRSGTVQVSFRVVDVQTAEILAGETKAASYSKKVTSDTDGDGDLELILKLLLASAESDELEDLKPRNAILSSLTDQVVAEFVPVVAPYRVTVTKTFEKGSRRTKQAITLAQSGLPDKALPIFEDEVQSDPSEKTFYNLGVCYEMLGRLEDAETQYDRAVSLDPKKLYIQALKDIRIAIKDREILEKRETP
jgi:curli biogenesis system outer membrane secretion channel CsgG